MPDWDYAGNGNYFITLVTQNRVCILGKINNNKIILSDFGKIVNNEWMKSFEIRDELFLDEYIIMPNHLHAIVKLRTNNIVDTNGRSYLQYYQQYQQYQQRQKHADLSNQSANNHQKLFIRKPKSISSFIAGFKSAVNSKIDDYIDENNLDIPKYNQKNHFFQPNYNDHIIRNYDSYLRIKNYIKNNPQNWTGDRLNNDKTEN